MTRFASVQVITRLRTWLLVAALTALAITFGALLAGAFVWRFAGLAVAFNLVGYYCSDRIALRLARAQPLEPTRAPEVHEAVRELAARAAVPMPRLYVMPGDVHRKPALGRPGGSAVFDSSPAQRARAPAASV